MWSSQKLRSATTPVTSVGMVTTSAVVVASLVFLGVAQTQDAASPLRKPGGRFTGTSGLHAPGQVAAAGRRLRFIGIEGRLESLHGFAVGGDELATKPSEVQATGGASLRRLRALASSDDEPSGIPVIECTPSLCVGTPSSPVTDEIPGKGFNGVPSASNPSDPGPEVVKVAPRTSSTVIVAEETPSSGSKLSPSPVSNDGPVVRAGSPSASKTKEGPPSPVSMGAPSASLTSSVGPELHSEAPSTSETRLTPSPVSMGAPGASLTSSVGPELRSEAPSTSETRFTPSPVTIPPPSSPTARVDRISRAGSVPREVESDPGDSVEERPKPKVSSPPPASRLKPDYLYNVSLRRRSNSGHFCGGALVGTRHVLTAAHCVAVGGIGDPRPDVVIGAALSTQTSGEGVQVVATKSVTFHPTYLLEGFPNLAILELEEEARQSPVKMPSSTDDGVGRGQTFTISGWGRTSAFSGNSDIVQSVRVTFVNSPFCSHLLGKVVRPEEVCAGGLNGEGGTCLGDGGAPVVILGESREDDVLVGIAGEEHDCGEKSIPDAHTRVLPFREWIQETIG